MRYTDAVASNSPSDDSGPPELPPAPDPVELEQATDRAADALQALSRFTEAVDKLRTDLGMPTKEPLPDAAGALRDAGYTVQLIGETVAERGPSEASRVLDEAGAAEQIREVAERIRAMTQALRDQRER